jgi:uncharacterized repeat protein (TIGR01451 family)
VFPVRLCTGRKRLGESFKSVMNDRADTSMFLDFCSGLLKRGLGVRFQACGTSMAPTIQHGENVAIEPVEAGNLRRGDVVLFTDGASLSLHRLVTVDHENDMYVTRGDARMENDPAINACHILGRAVAKEKICGATTSHVRLNGMRVGSRRILARGRRHLGSAARLLASATAMVSMRGVLCAVLALVTLAAAPAAFAQGCAVPGSGGDGGTLTGIVNTYYPGTASAAVGDTSIHVGTPTGSSTPIAVGDLLLVIQMQGATIDTSNDSGYGHNTTTASGYTALNNTGKYEFVRATGPVSGGVVPIYSGTTTNVGLLNAYTYAPGTSTFQVVRVPQYSTARLGSGLTAGPWSGTSTTGMSGGILALDIAGSLDLGSATVSVDNLGFRGGAGLQLDGGSGTAASYRWAAPAAYAGAAVTGGGASKGEGIAGTPRWVQFNNTYLNTGVDGYLNGSMGKGAPGNAGGGGNDNHPDTANDENSGGGGGANANTAHTANIMTGGMGGDSWNSNVTTVRGYGGSTIVPLVNLVVMGGGGGAGSRNNDDGDNQASSGGAGGGIVIIRAGSLTGTGTITANGATAYDNTQNDAGGGGGGGGSVVVVTASASTTGLSIQAHGGDGGNAWATHTSTADRHGPGGGGGGGAVFTSGAPTNVNVAGGTNGVTSGSQAYGATAGAAGYQSTAAVLSGFSGIDSGAECSPDLTITSTHIDNQYRGNAFTYSLLVTNVAALASTNGVVTVTDVLPFGLTLTGASGMGWTCTTVQQTATCTTPNVLTIGSSYPAITVNATVAANAPDSMINTATVSGGGDMYTANDTATDPTNVTSVTDLAVTIAATPAVNAGGNITCTNTVTNNGPSDATNAFLTQAIPANTTFSSIAAPAGWICSTPAVGGTGFISCTALNFAIGASVNIPVVFTVPAGTASGTVINEAASVSSLTLDANTANNTASAITTVGTSATADLAVMDSAAPNPVARNNNIVYTQTVTNNGAAAATTATFTESTPTNTTFQSLTSPTGWTCTVPTVGQTGTITCNRASVPAGYSGTFVLTVLVGNGAPYNGTISNTVTVGAANDSVAANNSDTAAVLVERTTQADIGLATVGSPNPVIAGDTISYTQVISANGPATAGAITFTQNTPAGTKFQSVTAPDGLSCTTPAVNGTGTITCTAAAGATPGFSANITVLLNVNSNATGSITSTATVTEAGVTDPITTNNTTTTVTTVSTSMDLMLATTATPAVVTAGNNITYQHTVTNTGPSAAATVSFSEAIPANTTFVSLTQPAGWSTCSKPAVGATGTITCNIASLAPGVTAITIVVKVNSGVTAGTIITGSATVSTTTYDTNPGNSSTVLTTPVVSSGQADLSVTNAGSPIGVMAGSNITYAQVVTNNGPAAAANLTFTDVLPANTVFASFAAPVGWTCSTPAVGSAGTVSCTSASLAASATANFSLVVSVNSATLYGTLINDVASVLSTTSDPNLGNNSAGATTVIGNQADLAVTTIGPATGSANSTISYTQTLVNNGPSSAAGVVWTEVIPTNATFQSMVVPTSWSCTTPAVGATGTITCSIASLPPTGVTPVLFPLTVHVNTGVASGTVINNSVSVASTTTDPVISNNSTTGNVVIVAATGQMDVAVTTVGTPGSVAAGGNLTYTQSVTNNGPTAAGALVFSQTVPLNTTFQSLTVPTDWTCGTVPGIGGTGTISCNATSLASGASSIFSLVVKVNDQAPSGTAISNSVNVSVTVGNDPYLANNSASTSNPTTGSDVADVAVTMTGTDTVLQGSNITYTATVTNNGTDTATNVLFTDPLPSDLAFVSASTTQGSCSQSGGTISCPIGTLANGVSATITIVATALTPDLISDTASVAADQSDPVMSNNTATVGSVIVYPTEVKLKSFTATNAGNKVILEWSTGSESHNLGFNVYRQQSGERVRINPSLIAGSALRLRRGAQAQAAKAYAFVDQAAGSGQSGYWLEDVDLNGVRTMHGPVYASASTLSASHARALTVAISATATFADASQAASTTSSVPRSHEISANVTPGAPTTTQQEIRFALAALPAVKISVQSEGWYKVPLSQLSAAGMNVRDTSLLHLFAEGVEQPILVTQDAGTSQMSIEFYGTGLDTQYSNTRVYWLMQGDSQGARIPQQTADGQSGFTPQSFSRTVELRDRTTFFAALMTPDGSNFFGDVVSTVPLDQVLNASNVAGSGGEPVIVEIVLQGAVAGVQHDVDVSFNGTAIGQMSFEGQAQGQLKVEVPFDLLHEGANTVTLSALNGDNDVSLVDHIALTYPRSYIADGNSLKFTASAGDNVAVTGFNAAARVVDITNPMAPVELLPATTGSAGSYSMQVQVPSSADGDHVLLAFAPGAVASPVSLVGNNPSQLHSVQRGADIVMIAYPDFAPALTALYNLRRSGGNLVSIITVDQIYDEFNFGEKSPYAIRDFLKSATDTWTNKPQYLLLAGNASVDPLNYLGMGSLDFVPTKIVPTSSLMTASDDWFSDFGNTGMPQISTGRLPVRTLEQAQAAAAKIVGYESGANTGPWQQQVLMVADKADDQDFSADTLSVQALLAPSYTVTDVFADQMDTATAKSSIVSAINSGKLLVNYIGHGSVDTWSDQTLLDTDAVAALQNGSRLPVFFAINCLNGYFYDVYQESMATALILAPNGGAVAVVASSGLTESQSQVDIDRALVKAISDDPMIALGDAVRGAKSGITDPDVRRTYMLFGDPSMRLNAQSGPPSPHQGLGRRENDSDPQTPAPRSPGRALGSRTVNDSVK